MQIQMLVGRANYRWITSLILSLFILFPASVRVQAHENKTEVLIRNVTLIDGTGAAPQPNIDLLIRGDKIVSINKAINGSHKATVIDGTNKYLIPGLIDTHAHLHFPVVFQLSPEEKQSIIDHTPRAFLYNGVTTVLNVSSNAQWSWRIREAQRKGVLVGPRIYALGHSFTAVDGWGSRHGGTFADAKAARKKALEYVDANTDGFKIIIEDGLGEGSGKYNEISDNILQGIISVSKEHHIPLYVHAIGLPEYRRAVKLQPKAIMHGLEDPVPADDPLIEELAKKQIAVVPTLSLFKSFLSADPHAGAGLNDPILEASVPTFLLRNMRQTEYMKMENQLFTKVARMDVYAWVEKHNPIFCDNVKKMHKAGVKIAVGTDAGGTVGFNFQGYNTPWEVKNLVECGLSPMQALVSATRVGAEVIGISDKLGTIEAGKQADILILSSNPLQNIENIRKIEWVIQNGKVHDRQEFAYKQP